MLVFNGKSTIYKLLSFGRLLAKFGVWRQDTKTQPIDLNYYAAFDFVGDDTFGFGGMFL